MTDAELLEELRSFAGTPAEALNDPELMELVLPTIRADFKLVETYRQPRWTSPARTPDFRLLRRRGRARAGGVAERLARGDRDVGRHSAFSWRAFLFGGTARGGSARHSRRDRGPPSGVGDVRRRHGRPGIARTHFVKEGRCRNASDRQSKASRHQRHGLRSRLSRIDHARSGSLHHGGYPSARVRRYLQQEQRSAVLYICDFRRGRLRLLGSARRTIN
jgi:hypothetical protein